MNKLASHCAIYPFHGAAVRCRPSKSKRRFPIEVALASPLEKTWPAASCAPRGRTAPAALFRQPTTVTIERIKTTCASNLHSSRPPVSHGA